MSTPWIDNYRQVILPAQVSVIAWAVLFLYLVAVARALSLEAEEVMSQSCLVMRMMFCEMYFNKDQGGKWGMSPLPPESKVIDTY